MVDRVKLDSADALIGAARRVPGLDVERFGIDLRSAAIVEAFGADMERARAAARESTRRAARAVSVVRPRGGATARPSAVYDGDPEELRAAALAAGATASGPLPGVLDALTRFGRIATPEVVAACDLPARAAAELWRLAAEWKLRAERVLTGELWSPPEVFRSALVALRSANCLIEGKE